MGAVPQRCELPGSDGRWSFPATLPHPRSTLAILPELDDATAYLFWLALRRVEAWVDAPAELRRRGMRGRAGPPGDVGTWRDAAAEDSEFAGAAAAFVALENDGTLIGAAQLAEACGAVSAWAERRALLEVTVQFAEAAARVEPESARRCNLAGRACRLASLWSRADHWYLRGVGLARRSRSMQEKFRAHLGAGAVAYRQGRFREARGHFLTGAWAAHRMGKRPLAARAQHDLMLLASEEGRHSAAMHHGERALAWYPKHHRRLPYLAHDFAFGLVVQGHFALALPLASTVLEMLSADHERLLVWGTIARAAGALGDVPAFRAAREQILTAAPGMETTIAISDLAEGARARGDWVLAEEAARQAMTHAQGLGLAAIERSAARLLSEIRNRAVSALPHACSAGDRTNASRLAAAFTYRLAHWRPRSTQPGE